MNRRPSLLLFLVTCVFAIGLPVLSGQVANAQPADDDEIQIEDDDDDTSGDSGKDTTPDPAGADDPAAPDVGGGPDSPDVGDPAGSGKPVKLGAEKKLGDTRTSWQDIVVVVRKPFLKSGRLELLPTWGSTMNDNIIRHFQFAMQLNYYLTDVLAVGLEGDLYVKDLREPFDLVARQARRLPTVNKYKYGGSLNFHYVPVYGKFAVLDKHIITWEAYFTAGVGFTQSEVLPRDPAFRGFKNFLVTPNVGASLRFFMTKWLTVNVGFRDYVFIDRFEPTNRGIGMNESVTDAKNNADSSLINNVVFQLGVSFWFPTSFEYTTFR